MLVAIACKGEDLDHGVEPVMGRAKFFLIVDSETQVVDPIPNPYSDQSRNAGLKVAELLMKKNIKAILAGNCGPKASVKLREKGIHVGIAHKGTARQALDHYLDYT